MGSTSIRTASIWGNFTMVGAMEGEKGSITMVHGMRVNGREAVWMERASMWMPRGTDTRVHGTREDAMVKGCSLPVTAAD